MSELFNDLCAYDGKAVTLLSEAQVRHGARPTYLSELVALSASEHAHVSDGATWLLKASAEQGRALAPDETRALIKNLQMIASWPAQLHICQMVGFLAVPADSAASLANWLTGLLGHNRPFLRAWSMSALSALAAQHSGYAAQAEAALQAAKADASASVRARARNVEKLIQRDRTP